MRHITHYMNEIWNALILLTFNDIAIQLWFLMFDAYLIVGLELLVCLYWKYDYS